MAQTIDEKIQLLRTAIRQLKQVVGNCASFAGEYLVANRLHYQSRPVILLGLNTRG